MNFEHNSVSFFNLLTHQTPPIPILFSGKIAFNIFLLPSSCIEEESGYLSNTNTKSDIKLEFVRLPD